MDKHVSDAAWERIQQADWPRWIFDGLEGAHKRAGVMLVTVEEWENLRLMEASAKELIWLRAHLADCYAWIDELEARLRSLVPNSGTNVPKSRTGALLLTREADARLGLGDAGEER